MGRRYVQGESKKAVLILFATLAGGVFSFWGWRKTTLPLGHKIGGSSLELRWGQLGDSRPGDALGDDGIGSGANGVPFAKARNGRQLITRLS